MGCVAVVLKQVQSWSGDNRSQVCLILQCQKTLSCACEQPFSNTGSPIQQQPGDAQSLALPIEYFKITVVIVCSGYEVVTFLLHMCYVPRIFLDNAQFLKDKTWHLFCKSINTFFFKKLLFMIFPTAACHRRVSAVKPSFGKEYLIDLLKIY